ncbi:carbohydrate sulfotransferase 1-like isoform X2 [Palaemon carinicauda]
MLRKWKLLILPVVCFGGLALFKNAHDVNKILTSSVSAIVSKYREESVDENTFYSDDYVNLKLDNVPVSSPENRSQSGEIPDEYTQVKIQPSSAENLKNISWGVHQTVANGVQEGKADPSIPKIKAILILSSVGRSGSSFLGEILASQGGNIYFFEPVRCLPNPNRVKKETILETLRMVFQCVIRDYLLNYGKLPGQTVRHPYVLENKGSVTIDKIRSLCLQEPLRIIKTIRTRLEWTKELLEDKSLDLKVIHLVRDPRGSFTSMNKLDWGVAAQNMCTGLKSDLEARKEMEQRYPDKYHFIKYEDICLDPFGKTQELFRFLNGNATKTVTGNKNSYPSKKTKTRRPHSYPDIPLRVFDYLQSHTKINLFSVKSAYGTQRDTSSHYQKWRYKIDQKILSEIELHCRDVIEMLGHRFFGTLKRARDMRIPLSNS